MSAISGSLGPDAGTNSFATEWHTHQNPVASGSIVATDLGGIIGHVMNSVKRINGHEDFSSAPTGKLKASGSYYVIADGGSAVLKASTNAVLAGGSGFKLKEAGTAIIECDTSRNLDMKNMATLDVDTSGAIQINSSGGTIGIGNDDVDQALNLGTDGQRAIKIGTASGTGSTPSTSVDIDAVTVTVDATSGGVSIDAAAASNFTTSAGALTLTSAAATTWSTSAGALTIDSAGVLTMDTDGTDNINLGTEAAAKTITIGSDTSSKVDVNAAIVELDSGGDIILNATTKVEIPSGVDLSFDGDAGAEKIGANGDDLILTAGTAINIVAGAIDASAQVLDFDLVDNNAAALSFDAAGQADILKIDTQNGAEKVIAHALDVTNNLVVNGNLDVNGTTTTIDSENMTVEDSIIGLGISGSDGSFSDAGHRGIIFARGLAKNVLPGLYYDGTDFVFAKTSTHPSSASFATPPVALTHPSLKTGAVLPLKDDTYDLGSTSLAWQDIHLEGDIKAQDAMEIDTAAGALTIDGAAGVNIQEGGTSIIAIADNRNLTVANAAAIDIDGSGAVTLDSTAGGITIGGVLADGQVMQLGKAGATEINLLPNSVAANEKIDIVNTSGTADTAIRVEAVAGGVTVKAGNDSLHLDADGTDADALNIDSAGGVDVDAAGLISLETSAGSIEVGPSLADGQTLKLGKNGAVETIIAPHGTAGSELYSVVNTGGDSDGSNSNAAAIQLTSTAGGMGLSWADGKDLWAEGGRAIVVANENAADAILLHADAGANQTIKIVNDAGTTDGTAGSGALDLEATAGGISLLWNDAKDLWMEGGRAVVTANEDAADAILLHADAGSSQTIKIVNDAGTTDGTAGAGALDLEATAGGISLLWNDGKDLWMEGGRAVLTANENAADCIKLHADAGTNQTISLLNDAGTSAAAVGLTATDGGITLTTDTGGAGGITLTSVGTTAIAAPANKLWNAAGTLYFAGTPISKKKTVFRVTGSKAAGKTEIGSAWTNVFYGDALDHGAPTADSNLEQRNIDVYVNGQMMVSGTTANNGDYKIHGCATDVIHFFFGLEADDFITVVKG
tara:strand:- start:8137 stop:11367 length:3231 start_codon:yes stop_codon:yes gene_type:complete